MELKFYLNKIIKIDNIEEYSLKSLMVLKNKYEDFIDKSGFDPDYPFSNLSGNKDLTKKTYTSNNKADIDINDL